MVPEKGKTKGRQSSLYDAPEEKPDNVDSLVARAFDSDPSVRLKVAQELGKIDDPRALFALIELSSDKDAAVKEAAQRSLSNFKEEKEEIVSLERLLAARKEQKSQASASPSPAVSQKMAPTIEKLFSHYEPKKRESVKRKLFPSLQKLFGFSKEELDPLQGLEKISQPEPKEGQKEAPPQRQEERIPQENAPNFPFGQKEEAPKPSDLVELSEEDHEVVGGGKAQEDDFGQEKQISQTSPSQLYSIAYSIASTPGMGKRELKSEMNRIISGFKKEVEMAFRMAQAKAREEGCASLSNLKPGMKNLSFAEMQIVSVEEIAYGAKGKPYARILLSDGKRQAPLLVPKERASGISPSDMLAPKKVDVDFLVEKNEVVLVASKKSKIIVVK
ncbi:MAG: HEAT repeat domain-containing protein [Candidatus Micrarchaeota archaeon]|nr:HEAT repeat domain-containing protein [Candidatus Micrarchaeota archaeon]